MFTPRVACRDGERLVAPSVEQVRDGEVGVAQQHARPGVAHHHAHPFAHVRACSSAWGT